MAARSPQAIILDVLSSSAVRSLVPADEIAGAILHAFAVYRVELTTEDERARARDAATRPPHPWIERLPYSVEVFDAKGSLLEVLARVHDVYAARATYDACVAANPGKLIMLCLKMQILRRSDAADKR